MNTNRILAGTKWVACVAASLAALAGCDQPSHDANANGMGPAQQAGKALDDVGAKATAKVHEEVSKADAAARQAREAVPNAVEQARTNLNQVTDKVGEKVEEAGAKMRESAK
jgi:L-ascorbate metabolism protein UlaG (beta-lactamase superfamily)